MFDDKQATSQPVTNDQQVQAQPTNAPATPSTPPQFQAPESQADAQNQETATAQQDTISNPGPVAKRGVEGFSPILDASDHPLVKKAGVIRSIAETLAGGPRYATQIDENGNRVRSQLPLSGRQIALAIAMEAIQGSLTGLAAG